MKILYISSTSSGIHTKGIYHDLMDELANRGHSVFVLYAREAREGMETELYFEDSICYLGVKTGNLTKNSNLFNKGYASISLDNKFKKMIKLYFKDDYFDLVLFSTPPITVTKTLKFLKRKGSFIYLMLKDIFPQNAVDINMISPNGIVFKYFKKKEHTLYNCSDKIGVMSPQNLKYFISENPSHADKVEVLPNALNTSVDLNVMYRSDFGLDDSDVLYLYGGNLGKPQGVSFIINCIDEFEKMNGAKFIICGSGTESELIKQHISLNNIVNTIFLGSLDSNVYNQLTQIIDVGLIFLDHRFTIPNFPQRILNYMLSSKPVICAVDEITDIGTIVEENGFGFTSISNDVSDWIENVLVLKNDDALRHEMGKISYKYFVDNYSVNKAVDTILKHFE